MSKKNKKDPQATQKPKEFQDRKLEKDKKTSKAKKAMTSDEAYQFDTLADRALYSASGGLAEATAKLKAKGFSDGGAVTKDKTVAMDKSPNSGLITQRGFGASKRT